MPRFNPCVDAGAVPTAPVQAPKPRPAGRPGAARAKTTKPIDRAPFQAQSDTMVALMLGQLGAKSDLVQVWRQAFETYCVEHPELKNWRPALSSFGLTIKNLATVQELPAIEMPDDFKGLSSALKAVTSRAPSRRCLPAWHHE